MSENRVVVGSLAGAFGVKGEVRLKSYCSDPEAIARYTPLTTDAGQTFRVIVITGQTPNGFSARIEGIDTKEQADALKGTALWAQRDRLPSLPDDEYYHADLIGISVFDSGGVILGRVKSVLNHGAGDILEVLPPGAVETMLLPFTLAIVPTVDLKQRRIVADPPEGLF